jgi:surfeit locus 1 family protein
MLERFRSAGLIRPAFMTVIGLSILCGLGTWQLQRKAWKEALIAEIEARTTAAPVSLDIVNGRATASDPDPKATNVDYMRVEVRGKFLNDKELYFYAPDPERGPGVHIYTPMIPSGQTAAVFVNRGYVPETLRDPKARAASELAGEVTITGLVRQTVQLSRFTPENDVAHNLWHWRDLAAMTKAAFGDENHPHFGFVIDQEAPRAGQTAPADSTAPQPGTTIVSLPNRHLEYALTWFGLAATLAGVFGAYAVSRLGKPELQGPQ